MKVNAAMHTMQHYIDGEWVKSQGPESIDVFDSNSGEVFGSVADGTAADVDLAVAAARRAFGTWSLTPLKERLTVIQDLADAVERRTDELANIMARESGTTSQFSAEAQVGFALEMFSSAVDAARDYEFESRIGSSLILREAIGVVGCITPWNSPLGMIGAKVGYALAAGCTTVVKPSELSPLDALVFAEIAEAVGLPKGVINIVTGGAETGKALVSHPDVDMITMTGSTVAGKRIMASAADTLKRVSLELGGKSALVLLDDLDQESFATAIETSMDDLYSYTGQLCDGFTRILVPESRKQEAEAVAVAKAQGARVGDLFDRDTELGALASQGQWERVQRYINLGVSEGADLLTGGPGMPEGIERGYFVKPTVFSGVTSNMTIAQEEIFGPVVAIMTYQDEADAVEIANDTVFGLSGAVWAEDEARAISVARQLRTGQIYINGGEFNVMAPFGGYKQSGVGREYGRHGLEEFLEVKSLQLRA
jgi:acyl-CoA reductase-like NAD-dependent aldehyde dehydrogenase